LQTPETRGQNRENLLPLAADANRTFAPSSEPLPEGQNGFLAEIVYKFHNCACILLKRFLKMTVTEFTSQSRQIVESREDQVPAEATTCYSVTIFTTRWKEMRDFYVEILSAEVISERPDRYCELNIGGVPLCLRRSESGEMVSYFHLYLSLKNREPVLSELRKRGIIVTNVGPYTNFRDPEGRVIKISETQTIIG